MPLLTWAFWLSALEHAVVAGAAAFAGTQVFTQGNITANTWKASAIIAGVAALYAFVRQVGAVQFANGTLKVGRTVDRAALLMPPPATPAARKEAA